MNPPRANPLIGIVSMLLAMAILPFLDVIAKHLGGLGERSTGSAPAAGFERP